ncbi:MAG: phage holin family protein [Deltaproteobacteria bacterium]
MIRIIVGWIVITIAILIAAYLIPGVRVRSAGTAIFAAAILGIINAILRPVLVFVTFPITIITFGLFLFVINALMFMLAGAIVPGFEVRSFWDALLGSLIVTVVSWISHAIFF